VAKRGLGKGLDALISSAAAGEKDRLEEIPVKDIKPNPRQPRQRFDHESIEQMARSIESFGVVQPVIVRPAGTDYELIAGERRWRAAVEAGLERIPALVKESSETDALEMALIENLHRADLNGIEEATAYQQLLDDFGITHEELSQRVGKSRVAVTNTIRLLQLPPGIQKAVVEESITTGHARALLSLQDNPELQEKIAERVARQGLSVRQTEDIVRVAASGGSGRSREKQPLPEEAAALVQKLGELLEARVKGAIGKRKGRLVIEFRNLTDLRRIFEMIAGPEADPGGEEAVEEGPAASTAD
jgi:ParB family chromosome partitioning protein